MVLAIANPLCCCTLGGLAWGDDAAGASAPICCGSNDKQAGSAPQEHDPDACPHKASLDYPRTAQHDVKTAQWQVDILPLLFVLHQPFKDGFTHTPVLANFADVRAGGYSVGLMELYCVYRI